MNPSKENLKFAVKYPFSGNYSHFYSDKFNINKFNIFSYDTEALNKQLIQSDSFEQEQEQFFVNTFGDTEHKKTTLGVQQLYIIGKISTFFYSLKCIVILYL
jgi:hypothetical protein